jgi:hypothetical protein
MTEDDIIRGRAEIEKRLSGSITSVVTIRMICELDLSIVSTLNAMVGLQIMAFTGRKTTVSPPQPAQPDRGEPPNLRELKARMAAAHPCGGSSAEFIAARDAYVLVARRSTRSISGGEVIAFTALQSERAGAKPKR